MPAAPNFRYGALCGTIKHPIKNYTRWALAGSTNQHPTYCLPIFTSASSSKLSFSLRTKTYNSPSALDGPLLHSSELLTSGNQPPRYLLNTHGLRPQLLKKAFQQLAYPCVLSSVFAPTP